MQNSLFFERVDVKICDISESRNQNSRFFPASIVVMLACRVVTGVVQHGSVEGLEPVTEYCLLASSKEGMLSLRKSEDPTGIFYFILFYFRLNRNVF